VASAAAAPRPSPTWRRRRCCPAGGWRAASSPLPQPRRLAGCPVGLVIGPQLLPGAPATSVFVAARVHHAVAAAAAFGAAGAGRAAPVAVAVALPKATTDAYDAEN
jgi:hypothetical protein